MLWLILAVFMVIASCTPTYYIGTREFELPKEWTEPRYETLEPGFKSTCETGDACVSLGDIHRILGNFGRCRAAHSNLLEFIESMKVKPK